jgi:hypothetical protein
MFSTRRTARNARTTPYRSVPGFYWSRRHRRWMFSQALQDRVHRLRSFKARQTRERERLFGQFRANPVLALSYRNRRYVYR